MPLARPRDGLLHYLLSGLPRGLRAVERPERIVSAHLLDGDHLACVPGIVITGALRVLDARPTIFGVTCAECLAVATPPVVLGPPVPPPPVRCAWCRLLPAERRRAHHTQLSTHTIPIEIRALPGATFRTTKYEVAEGATGAGRHASPTWKPPADVGRAFAKAIRRGAPAAERPGWDERGALSA